jgi:hypothetical protein
VRAALQLHTIAPSSPLSHSASDLQLPEFLISLQSLAPMQAHFDSLTGRLETVKLSPYAHAPNERRYHESQNEKGYLHSAPPFHSVILVYELSDIVAEDPR